MYPSVHHFIMYMYNLSQYILLEQNWNFMANFENITVMLKIVRPSFDYSFGKTF
jgi:hypothetical protein